MKTFKFFTIAFVALFCAVTASSQTANEIISKHIQAIGGKDLLTKITSVYSESTMDIMGNQGNVKTTILNGKGMKQEMDIMGNTMITCYTDKGGWSINPMTGATTAEAMPETQYKSGKDQIVLGAPFINYAEKGSKADLMGTDSVGSVNAYKIKLIAPDSTSSVYFIDPATFYLIKTIQSIEVQGSMTDNEMTFSDYRQVEGYAVPYKIDMNIAGGQFQISITVSKVELNKPVDEAIFSIPK
jgi:hypothetical protein